MSLNVAINEGAYAIPYTYLHVNLGMQKVELVGSLRVINRAKKKGKACIHGRKHGCCVNQRLIEHRRWLTGGSPFKFSLPSEACKCTP